MHDSTVDVLPRMESNQESEAQASHRLRRTFAVASLAIISLLGNGHSTLPERELLMQPDSVASIDTTITVMTANVHSWTGPDGDNFDRFMEVLDEEDPDVICMQEVLADGHELQELYRDGYNVIFDTTYHYPFRGRYGNATASRSPLRHVETVELSGPDEGLSLTPPIPRNALIFDVETIHGSIRFSNTHLGVPRRESVAQSNQLFAAGKDNIDIMCGDFNQTSSVIVDGAFGSMATTTFAAFEQEPTFPARKPRIAIDHVLWRCGEVVRSLVRRPNIGSDHLAAIVAIDMEDCQEE